MAWLRGVLIAVLLVASGCSSGGASSTPSGWVVVTSDAAHWMMPVAPSVTTVAGTDLIIGANTQYSAQAPDKSAAYTVTVSHFKHDAAAARSPVEVAASVRDSIGKRFQVTPSELNPLASPFPGGEFGYRDRTTGVDVRVRLFYVGDWQITATWVGQPGAAGDYFFNSFAAN
jgi:hypothetical protein